MPSTILTAADPAWDEARRPWNLAVDQRPTAITRPASAQDVVTAVTFARDRGLRVAAQGTGHGLAGLAGSSPDVGVIGDPLGGGMAWLTHEEHLFWGHAGGLAVATRPQQRRSRVARWGWPAAGARRLREDSDREAR